MRKRKPSYNVYRNNDKLYRGLRKMLPPEKRHAPEINMRELATATMIRCVSISAAEGNHREATEQFYTALQFVADWRFAQTSRRTWFVDPRLLEALDRVDFDVKFSEALPPYHQVSIAFPTETGLPGVLWTDFRIPSAHVLQSYYEELERVRQELALDAPCLEPRDLLFQMASSEVKERDRVVFVAASEAEDQKISEVSIDDRMSSKYGSLESLHFVVSKVLAYVRAFPSSLREGFPSLQSKEGEGHVLSISDELKTALKQSQSSGVNSPPSVHFRRGHIRALRDERYKRDEAGQIRIVWVKPTYVAGQLDPYTVDS